MTDIMVNGVVDQYQLNNNDRLVNGLIPLETRATGTVVI